MVQRGLMGAPAPRSMFWFWTRVAVAGGVSALAFRYTDAAVAVFPLSLAVVGLLYGSLVTAGVSMQEPRWRLARAVAPFVIYPVLRLWFAR